MSKIVDRQASSEIEEKFAELVETCRHMDRTQELLVAMAATMQQELTHHANRGKLPHAEGIDPVMRAVEHLLRDDPAQYGYALKKLNFGTKCLNNWLTSPVRS